MFLGRERKGKWKKIGGVNMRAGTRELGGSESEVEGRNGSGDDKIPFLCTIGDTVRNPE